MMVKFKISKDGNEKKYIPLIRKMMNRSLSEIRECLCNNGYIDICGLYEDDRVVETDFLKNIIEAHFDTERYLQETDDKVIEQD